MRAPLARWHGPGGPPGRGAATGPRAPRPGRETAVGGARLGVLGGHAPRRRRAHGAPHAAGRPPGALSLSGAAGRVTCGRPEHLMEHLAVEKRRAGGVTTPGRPAARRRGE